MDLNALAIEAVEVEAKQQGQAGYGLSVTCHPDERDDMIIENRNRASCLVRPYPTCSSCPHSTFTLVFKTRESRSELVACPRWNSPEDRMMDKAPSKYVATEVATCRSTPFDFCVSCPSVAHVAFIGADKTSDGWYGRWNRLKEEQSDEE